MFLRIGTEFLQTCSLMRAKSIDDSFNAEFTRNIFFVAYLRIFHGLRQRGSQT